MLNHDTREGKQAMNMQLSALSEYAVRIPCESGLLDGVLVAPAGATGLVIFAHGSGSSRLSPRNRMVADAMHQRHIATLLMDLLTPQEAVAEERTGVLRFNIPFLTSRLLCAIQWAETHEKVAHLGIGLFGASTGSAAALCAAARMPQIQAVVSRGGRTDMAGGDAKKVWAPTLLIVGEEDPSVMEWNEESFAILPGIKHLLRIPGATHLFPEPGALEQVATAASDWFAHYLSPQTRKGSLP